MNWINGPAVISPIQSDIFCRGLGSYLFREHPAARFYNPVDEIDEIVNNLAKIQYRDTESVMSFVGKYGLLGRGPLRIHETRITPVLEDGVQLNDDEEFL